jgi:hypothetical protein
MNVFEFINLFIFPDLSFINDVLLKMRDNN